MKDNNTSKNEGRVQLRTIDETVDELVGKEHLYGLIYEPGNTDELEVSGIVSKTLDTLTDREKEVIKRRFLSDETLQTIATAMGVGRERVRQVEAVALRKLRHPDRIRNLTEIAYSLGVITNNDDEKERKRKMEKEKKYKELEEKRLDFNEWIKESTPNNPLRLLFHA
jgi:hypothetical protein